MSGWPGVPGLGWRGLSSSRFFLDFEKLRELFDKQPENYRKDVLEENSLIVTLEAGNIMSWQKYVNHNGINLGIDKFGESAPYKEVYSHLDLSEEKITSFIQKKLRE